MTEQFKNEKPGFNQVIEPIMPPAFSEEQLAKFNELRKKYPDCHMPIPLNPTPAFEDYMAKSQKASEIIRDKYTGKLNCRFEKTATGYKITGSEKELKHDIALMGITAEEIKKQRDIENSYYSETEKIPDIYILAKAIEHRLNFEHVNASNS